jgi:hypothetical protein
MADPSVEKTYAIPMVEPSTLVDNLFFLFGGAATVWLAYLVISESFSWGWFLVLFFVLFWVMLAYLVLPRLHRILTAIYVPDYFIGRARTSDGLLGDPINLAALGSEAQLHDAMVRAGWTRADVLSFRSGWRIVTSTLLKRSYDEAPVSPLLLFGRQQDYAYQQEVQGNPSKRHHVRFWRCPDDWMLPGGIRTDWLAAGTFDRAVGFSLFTLQITHKIDANTDVERDHIVKTLEAAGEDISVHVVKDFSAGYHSRNGGGDTIETDGDLPIVDVREVKATPDPEARVIATDSERAIEKRPAQTTIGVVLMVLRILTGALSIVTSLTGWHKVVSTGLLDDALGVADRSAAYIVVGASLAVFATGLLFYCIVAYLVAKGSNWARVAAMSLSAVTVVAAAVNHLGGHPQPALFSSITALLGLPLDILVVLSLSSQASRIWAKRHSAERKARRELVRQSRRTTARAGNVAGQ